jgi:SAM-dependent methyltransferase
LVHELFAATSGAFLRAQLVRPPTLAIDLGCGAGWSTVALGEATAARLVAGLDASARWITLAQRFRTERRRFFVHDVATIPFPVGPAELLYSRLLLTHLPNPAGVLARWATQLQPGGRLVLEEVEQIGTAHPVFGRYLELVARVAAHDGVSLFIGPILATLEPVEELVRIGSEVRPLAVKNATAASLFQSNLRGWRTHPAVLADVGADDLRALERDLARVATRQGEAYDTEWSVRQVAYERA